jgi:hypothetical protein
MLSVGAATAEPRAAPGRGGAVVAVCSAVSAWQEANRYVASGS